MIFEGTPGGRTAWNTPDLAVEVLIWRAGGYDACDPRAIRKAVGASQARILRDLFGPQPFRPLPTLPPCVKTWNDGCVAKLAKTASQERSLPAGTLDNARLTALADALEEAGVVDQNILGHLRQQGTVHVRGCHLLDLILGKE